MPLHTLVQERRFSTPVIFKDPRLFQLTALGSFLIFGILQLGWQHDIKRFLVLISFTLLAQCLAIVALKLPIDSWKSGLISGLGLCLLFHSSSFWILAMAAIIAIGSKYLIRWKGTHIFNPANFGIIIPLLLTNEAWVNTGQWGSGVMLAFFFASAALMVLMKVGRIDTSVTFLLTLFALESLRSVFYLEWDFDVVFHKMMNGSVLLFAFFMITDPRTTPNRMKGRIIWAALIGVLSFALTSVFYLHTAPIWALFIATPFTLFMNHLFGGKTFNWKPISHITKQFKQ
ncbi:MAG: Na+-transporting NADH:ubiquinone oxidoreductase subunit NqrB [Flavobacteriales bacterium]|jgi:Na+-transporting NADH:ubiquinone oxidoreductase subunit NqrB